MSKTDPSIYDFLLDHDLLQYIIGDIPDEVIKEWQETSLENFVWKNCKDQMELIVPKDVFTSQSGITYAKKDE